MSLCNEEPKTISFPFGTWGKLVKIIFRFPDSEGNLVGKPRNYLFSIWDKLGYLLLKIFHFEQTGNLKLMFHLGQIRKPKNNFPCGTNVSLINFWFPNTVEVQWLEHLWNHENMFETGIV